MDRLADRGAMTAHFDGQGSLIERVRTTPHEEKVFGQHNALSGRMFSPGADVLEVLLGALEDEAIDREAIILSLKLYVAGSGRGVGETISQEAKFEPSCGSTLGRTHEVMEEGTGGYAHPAAYFGSTKSSWGVKDRIDAEAAYFKSIRERCENVSQGASARDVVSVCLGTLAGAVQVKVDHSDEQVGWATDSTGPFVSHLHLMNPGSFNCKGDEDG